MKIYILDVEVLTENYHSSGGLVVVASDLEAAKKLVGANDLYADDDWREPFFSQPTETEWKAAQIYHLSNYGSYEPSVRIFPNAGCC